MLANATTWRTVRPVLQQKLLRVLLIVFFAQIVFIPLLAQEAEGEILQEIQELTKKVEAMSNRVISFGLTAGPRLSFSSGETTNAFIDPVDSTLQFNDYDKASFVISASIIASPFMRKKKRGFMSKNKSRQATGKNKDDQVERILRDTSKISKWSRVFFMLNIDIAEFNSSSFNFNQSVDGGIGLGYFLGDSRNFGIGFTLDKVTKRVLSTSMEDRMGEQIPAPGGGVLTKINKDDDDYFQTDSDGAISLWFVYRFGSF